MEERTPDPGAVASVAARVLGGPVDGEPTPLAGGFDNDSWVVATAGTRVIVRIARPGADPTKVRAAWRAQQLAVEAGVPTGRGLHFVERCDALAGRAVRLVEFVDGFPAEDALAQDGATEVFFRTLGEALARLHRVALPAFSSRVDGSAPGFPTWRQYVDHRVPAITRRSLDAGAFTESELRAIFDPLPRLCDAVAHVVAPVLTHRDLHLANLLTDPHGGLRAILDWDAAEAWDAAVDLVKLRWQVLRRHPAGEVALWSGYSSGTPPPM
ncbi:MAG: aminoglycoside phosphotransferase family protein, partial [Acidimicrobiales bacterium]